MISAEGWAGVDCLIDKYIEAAPDDFVLIAFSPSSREAAAWVSAGLALRKVVFRRVPMTPLIDLGFGSRLRDALSLKSEGCGRTVILTLEKETMSHDRIIREVLAGLPEPPVVIRSISCCEELFSTALRSSPADLTGYNTALLEALMPAKCIRVTTLGGTNLTIGLDSEAHRWISNRGRARRGSFTILPAGEVATYPADIEGVLVADFAFNVNAFTDVSANLANHPVRVVVKEGKAVDFSCENEVVFRFLQDCFSKHCAFNVGELGFGTNQMISRPIDLNSHINERRPGVHLGFGQHNQGRVVDYKCDIHLDLIANGGLIELEDGSVINLQNISPSFKSHPQTTRDEDVFSSRFEEIEIEDCCGILTAGGLTLFEERPRDAEKFLGRS